MSDINRTYFLHFLDRELLEIQGIYNHNLTYSLRRDMRIILSCTTNFLIIPSAFLFESKYAEQIHKEFRRFFISGKILVSLSYASVKKMIEIKKEQFKGNEKDFPNYFYHIPDLYDKKKLHFFYKNSNTTDFIADRMIDKFQQKEKNLRVSNVPYIIDTIENRKNKAITHHLFKRIYDEKHFSTIEKNLVNDLITEAYIKSYLEFFNASIFSGLSSGIFQYDYLDNNAPFSSISFWIKLYHKIGVYDFICQSNKNNFSEIVASEEQFNFLRTIEKLVNQYDSMHPLDVSNDFDKYIKHISNYSCIYINNVDSYFNRLRNVKNEINELLTKGGIRVMRTIDEVFVVHGRNEKIKNDFLNFLGAINIKALEWEEVVKLTGSGTPTTLEVVSKGISTTSATIILLTGDDEVRLKNEFCKNKSENELTPQARPNVILEAGMSIAINKEKTVLVYVGECKKISDLDGINYIQLSNDSQTRNALATRLSTMGLKIDTSGSRWLTIGNFD